MPNLVKLPGFCDVHVHFREPGFSYKETILTGSKAAARGGYTAVCTMPNLNPVPDNASNLAQQLDITARDACIHVYPYGAITVGELGEEIADLEGMAPSVVAFSDDGRGVQSEQMMRKAMQLAKSLGKKVVAHCEVNELLRGGYIHDGRYAAAHGHKGICSESEWAQIERDCRLAEETGCAYHVCHISCKESVEIIRKAKARGVDVTCETAPHYLVLCEDDIKEDYPDAASGCGIQNAGCGVQNAGWWKMNPPLRAAEDKAALIEGVKDGTIDMIATDHAPHTLEEKSRGLSGSAFGIVGLEIAFPLIYTKLVKPGIISLERALELLVSAPRKRFDIPLDEDDYSVWDLDAEFTVDPSEFLTMGRATPFAGEKLFGLCHETYCGGELVYKK